MTGDAPTRAARARRLREQAAGCGRIGSPLYEALLRGGADDVEAGGPVWRVLDGQPDDGSRALALRFMGAVHRLVLTGRAPALACYYPNVGGERPAAEAWPAFRDAVDEHADELRRLVRLPVQTNEVGRSAALLGGFLEIARATGLPLRLLEAGASAGLNLRWDRYWYGGWGSRDSPVRFDDVFADGVVPDFDVDVAVADRLGCDRSPVDPLSSDGRLTLTAYVWPDQLRRHELLRGAIEVARRVPAIVEAAEVPEWLDARLADEAGGRATVVYHSVVMQYLDEDDLGRVRATIAEAGARATGRAPLAWLRMEPAFSYARLGWTKPEVWLTLWPGGRERVIARADPHGIRVRWLGL